MLGLGWTGLALSREKVPRMTFSFSRKHMWQRPFVFYIEGGSGFQKVLQGVSTNPTSEMVVRTIKDTVVKNDQKTGSMQTAVDLMKSDLFEQEEELENILEDYKKYTKRAQETELLFKEKEEGARLLKESLDDGKKILARREKLLAKLQPSVENELGEVF